MIVVVVFVVLYYLVIRNIGQLIQLQSETLV